MATVKSDAIPDLMRTTITSCSTSTTTVSTDSRSSPPTAFPSRPPDTVDGFSALSINDISNCESEPGQNSDRGGGTSWVDREVEACLNPGEDHAWYFLLYPGEHSDDEVRSLFNRLESAMENNRHYEVLVIACVLYENVPFRFDTFNISVNWDKIFDDYVKSVRGEVVLHPTVWARHARHLINRGSFQEADKLLSKELDRAKEYAAIGTNRGWAYRSIEESMISAAHFLQIKGEIQYILGLWTNAALFLIASIHINKSLTNTHNNLLVISLQFLIKILMRYSSRRDYAELRQYIHFNKDNPLDEAFMLCQQAIELSKKSPQLSSELACMESELFALCEYQYGAVNPRRLDYLQSFIPTCQYREDSGEEPEFSSYKCLYWYFILPRFGEDELAEEIFARMARRFFCFRTDHLDIPKLSEKARQVELRAIELLRKPLPYVDEEFLSHGQFQYPTLKLECPLLDLVSSSTESEGCEGCVEMNYEVEKSECQFAGAPTLHADGAAASGNGAKGPTDTDVTRPPGASSTDPVGETVIPSTVEIAKKIDGRSLSILHVKDSATSSVYSSCAAVVGSGSTYQSRLSEPSAVVEGFDAPGCFLHPNPLQQDEVRNESTEAQQQQQRRILNTNLHENQVYLANLLRYHAIDNQWHYQKTLVHVHHELKLDKNKKGTFRDVINICHLHPHHFGVEYVAKRYREQRPPKEYHNDVITHQISRYYVNLFNQELESYPELNLHNQIQMISVVHFEILGKDNEIIEFLNAEPFIRGKFTKFTNNNDYVNRRLSRVNTEVMLAFTHFTWCRSGRVLMVTDLQGFLLEDERMTVILTDPAINSPQLGTLGIANMGNTGFQNFWSKQHVECNEICKRLGLERYSP